jgi:L-ascorbate metabolism protein UlaG (beta-lactamase superfamily)
MLKLLLITVIKVECSSMNHGGSWTFDFGKVKYVNAIHSSSFPDGTGGNPGRFVIEGEHKKHIHSW